MSPKFSSKANPSTNPRNISFDWEQWLSEGIADEATLRSQVLGPNDVADDVLTQHVMQRCRALNIPLHYNRYLTQVGPSFAALRSEIAVVRQSGQFRSFILYEGKRLIGPNGDDSLMLRGGQYGTQAHGLPTTTSSQ